MSDERKLKRVETLLAIGRNAEQAAQQAFDIARGQADELQSRLAQLESAMIAQHEAARQRLVEAGLANFAGSYRDGVSTLRRQIARLVAREKVVDAELEDRRADLFAAMTRRKAAEIVRDRLRARQVRRAAWLETRQLDEAHAAMHASPVSTWRQGAGSIEGHRT